jgi:DNA-binding HxlR family transcriptional regulator
LQICQYAAYNATMPKKEYGQRCPVARTLELVGDRWTLLIVRDLLGGTRRFQDLQRGLPGLAPNILSDRLKLMEEHGLVVRRFYSDHPPRAEYALTPKGQELGVVIGALAAWGSRHAATRARLVDAESGQEVRLGYFRADTGERVSGRRVRLGRGAPSRRPSRAAHPAPSGRT